MSQPVGITDKSKLLLTHEQYSEMDNDMTGVCTFCGEHRPNCEPDAKQYKCEKCGLYEVYGMEELVAMDLIEFTDDGPATLDDLMRREVSRNLLRYAVQRAMFCPRCQSILDIRTAVLYRDHVVCVKCWDATLDQMAAKRHVKREDICKEIPALAMLDGRTLFP